MPSGQRFKLLPKPHTDLHILLLPSIESKHPLAVIIFNLVCV